MADEIHALPAVAWIGAGTFVASMWLLHRRRLLSAGRAFVALTLAVYLAGIVANTIFPIFIGGPELSRSWSSGLALVPFTDYEVRDALTNMLVFVPLGGLIPIVLGTSSPTRVIVVAAAVSLSIEVTQYASGRLLNGGHISDVNDLLYNVVGAAIGFGLFRVASRIRTVSETVDRLRWRAPAAHDR